MSNPDWSDTAGTHCGDCGSIYPPHHPDCPRALPWPDNTPPTLRQRYAMAALTGLCANSNIPTTSLADELAKVAYRIADAMLAEEQRK